METLVLKCTRPIFHLSRILTEFMVQVNFRAFYSFPWFSHNLDFKAYFRFASKQLHYS